MHTRFEAKVIHEPDIPKQDAPKVVPENPDEIRIDDLETDENVPTILPQTEAGGNATVPPANPDEIKLDDEEDEVVAPPPPPPKPKETRFLALDKCLPKRRFLEVSAARNIR